MTLIFYRVLEIVELYAYAKFHQALSVAVRESSRPQSMMLKTILPFASAGSYNIQLQARLLIAEWKKTILTKHKTATADGTIMMTINHVMTDDTRCV